MAWTPKTVLEWIHGHRVIAARWLVDGRAVRGEPSDEWTHNELRADDGAKIRVSSATCEEIADLLDFTGPDLVRLNAKGLASL